MRFTTIFTLFMAAQLGSASFFRWLFEPMAACAKKEKSLASQQTQAQQHNQYNYATPWCNDANASTETPRNGVCSPKQAPATAAFHTVEPSSPLYDDDDSEEGFVIVIPDAWIHPSKPMKIFYALFVVTVGPILTGLVIPLFLPLLIPVFLVKIYFM
ncbi:hypothetical protein MKZ38_004013 [Zalerion maritima]|uniref:Uncharacterized protein n=1 Tax=Zalerion maritima TaxID=339359 RepID=A0AAD5RMV1_9PEZI|nr:hypothetical protein MKZ38_004013 [Zalerion maritima]